MIFDTLLAAGIGGAIGLAYFGSLWWTVARLGRWRRPGLALPLSLLLRNAGAALAFVALARLGIAPLLAGFVGFLAVRALLVRRLGPVHERMGRGAEP